nr:hypothetical protein [Tanacetum cinerariifolium]
TKQTPPLLAAAVLAAKQTPPLLAVAVSTAKQTPPLLAAAVSAAKQTPPLLVAAVSAAKQTPPLLAATVSAAKQTPLIIAQQRRWWCLWCRVKCGGGVVVSRLSGGGGWGGVIAREGEWRGGSDRSGDEETFWFRRKNPAEKVFRRWRPPVANSIQYEGYLNPDSHDSYFHQSNYDRTDFEKSLTELNNDVRSDLEDFKRCVCSMRTVHWKLFCQRGGSGKSDDPPKTQKDPPLCILVKNKSKKD